VWTYLVIAIGSQPKRADDALALEPIARLAIKRAGTTPMLEGDLEYNLGTASLAKGDYARATKAYENAMQLRQRVFGDKDAELWKLYNGLGGAYLKSGNIFGARQAFEKALLIVEKVYGPTHPSIVYPLSSLAALEQMMGRYEEAFALHSRALKLHEELYGP